MKDALSSSSIEMDEAVALSILDMALAAHPLEACGLLIGSSPTRITSATLARNIAMNPENRFEIDPGHLAALQRLTREQDMALIGCWHSHPNGTLVPSADDVAGADWPGLVWLIVGNGAMRLWRPVAGGFAPLPLVRRAAAA